VKSVSLMRAYKKTTKDYSEVVSFILPYEVPFKVTLPRGTSLLCVECQTIREFYIT